MFLESGGNVLGARDELNVAASRRTRAGEKKSLSASGTHRA
jgi:hypothetical protein